MKAKSRSVLQDWVMDLPLRELSEDRIAKGEVAS